MARRIVKLKHRIVRALALPPEAVEDIPRVWLLGRGCMLLENHKGVYEYRAERVRLMSGEGVLCVTGKDLVLRELSRERLYIEGDIAGFCYEESGKSAKP